MEKTKTTITTTALILMLAISTTIVALPTAISQETPWKETFAVIGATPNPVGVNQEVLLWVGITDALASVELGWENITVSVTKPDGTTETLGPIKTDATGATGYVYVPTMTGTYILQTHFPEQINPVTALNIPAGTVMKASVSEPLELVVQEEPIPGYPKISLPSEYWGRPIDAQFREWNEIAGNWLMYHPNKFAPCNDVPETPHVLWAKKLQMGGLAGGVEYGPQAFECGDAYEGLFANNIIIGGVLFYNHYKAGFPTQEVVAVDLHTGEELWRKPLTTPDGTVVRLSFGQVFYWDSFNYHAVFPYLWATTGGGGFGPPTPENWHAFDPTDGQWVYSMENVPPGTNLRGPKGEIYRYTVDLKNGWMTLWNSSRVVTYGRTGPAAGSWLWRDMGKVFDATRGIEWNVTIPTGLPGAVNAYLEDRVIGTDTQWMRFTDYPVHMWGISTAPGSEGTLLFNTTWEPTQKNLTLCFGAVSEEDGVFVLAAKETRQFYGFSIDTGEYLWGPSEPKPMLDMYDITASSFDLFIHASQSIAYGKLLSGGTGGVAAAYDVKTGKLLWTYEADDPYNEILWGVNWPLRPAFIADGKIILSHQEHSPIDPKPRGAPFICLDVETGEEVWRVDGAFRGNWWGGHAIIGDSIIVTMDSYDQRIYAIGKGPTKITATASPESSVLGRSVLIKGMVTDESPGTKDPVIQMRFPNGVPAVHDDCMAEWMKYVYKQFERPNDVAGVEVKLEVVMDPNGNHYDIGTTTTDSTGYYSLSWKPPVPGHYLILATFAGSDSYYGSYAETSIVVDEAPSPATPIEPEQPAQPEQPTQPEQPEAPTEPEQPAQPEQPTQPTQPEQPTEPTQPEQPAEAAPLFSTTDLAIIVAVAVAVVIGAASLYLLRRRK